MVRFEGGRAPGERAYEYGARCEVRVARESLKPLIAPRYLSRNLSELPNKDRVNSKRMTLPKSEVIVEESL